MALLEQIRNGDENSACSQLGMLFEVAVLTNAQVKVEGTLSKSFRQILQQA
jgi:hypothetical protein